MRALTNPSQDLGQRNMRFEEHVQRLQDEDFHRAANGRDCRVIHAGRNFNSSRKLLNTTSSKERGQAKAQGLDSHPVIAPTPKL
jgi:hypothetical protein